MRDNTQSFQDFQGLFRFDPTRALQIGIERERFITDRSGRIVPQAPRVLGYLSKIDIRGRLGYELSACQVEDHSGPCEISSLESELAEGDDLLDRAVRALGLGVSYEEVAPYDMPLDVYPDPSGRYQRITKNMPVETLRAACRVIGTHVHIGMPDAQTALKVHNKVIGSIDQLCAYGDNSHGERLRIYRTVAGNALPRVYESWQDFHETAKSEGFDCDLRRCWYLVRISRFGTLEFRMFGSTEKRERVAAWAAMCYTLCKQAM